jgi:hypothetical protein
MAIFDPFAIMEARKSRQMSKNVIQIGLALAFGFDDGSLALADRRFAATRAKASTAWSYDVTSQPPGTIEWEGGAFGRTGACTNRSSHLRLLS